MVENRLKLRRSLFLGTGGRLFVWRGGIVQVQHFTGITVNILCTVNDAGDPLTVNRVSSQSSEDHYTYAYLPLEEVLYREAG